MEIVWRSAALEDLDNAYLYIAENNPRAAARVRNRIMTSAARLAMLPSLGRPGRVEGRASWSYRTHHTSLPIR